MLYDMVIKCYKSLYIYISMCVCIHLIHWNCSPNKAIKLVIAMESDDLVSKSKGFWNKGVWNDLNVFQTFGKQQKVQGWTIPMGFIFFSNWNRGSVSARPGALARSDTKTKDESTERSDSEVPRPEGPVLGTVGLHGCGMRRHWLVNI